MRCRHITIKNTVFNSCSTTELSITAGDITWAAPIRIVSSNGATSKVNVENCTFSLKEGEKTCNGDILLGDGREGYNSYQTISLSVSGTAAEIQIQKPGDRGADYCTPSGTITVTKDESLNELANAVAKIGDKLYADFHEAMSEATSGNTVELLMDTPSTAGSRFESQRRHGQRQQPHAQGERHRERPEPRPQCSTQGEQPFL